MHRSTLIHVTAGLFAACLAIAPARITHAQGASSSKQQFGSAQALFEAKKYAEALPEFRAVFAESGSPNARLYVARCLRELGDLPAAYEEMSATLKDARTKAETDPKYEKTRDASAAELAILDGKVAKVVIALADDAKGAEVTLNAEPLAAAKLGTPIAVMPGAVVIQAKLAGHDTANRRATVKAGDASTITISFSNTDATPVAVAPIAPVPGPTEPPPPADNDSSSGGGVRTAGFVVGGIGVVGAVVFAIAGSMGSSKYSSVNTQCGGVRCTDPSVASAIDSGKQLDTIANVGLVVGLVGVVGGVTMIALGGAKKSANAPSASVGFVPAPGGGAFRFSGAF